MLVKYFYRGSWWPPDRVHLTTLQEQASALKAAGIELQVLSAEPGGEEEVRKRLLEREVPQLDFTVIADPDKKFLNDSKLPQDIFIIDDFEIDYTGPYKMIQPALVVFDDDGNLIPEMTWSWKTMGTKENPIICDLHGSARVDTEPWAGPVQKAMLLTMRPLASDIIAAIQEKRQIKLASTHPEW